MQTITNNLNSGRTETLTYDNLNRISTAQSQATSGTYCWGQSIPTDGTGYDRYGNLLIVNVSKCTAPALSLSVNTNNQITNSGFTYDASGNMTSDGRYAYAWDARHLLQSAVGVTYTYDGDGKRVMKSNGTLYWNSPDGTPLAELNSSGTTLNEYIFFDGARTARRDSSGNVYYYFQDQLGTTKTLTTSVGVVCYDADLLPFGYEMAYVNSCSQNYKFTGLERDGETGLDHTLYRKYDSSVGRWLTPDRHRGDPLNPQSWNRYTYVLDNPINLTDPYGLTDWWQVGRGAIQLAAGGVGLATTLACGGLSWTGLAATCAVVAGVATAHAVAWGTTNIIVGLLSAPGTQQDQQQQQAIQQGESISSLPGLITFSGCAVGGGGADTCTSDAGTAGQIGQLATDGLTLFSGTGTISSISNIGTMIDLGTVVIDSGQQYLPYTVTVSGTASPAPTVDAPVNSTLVDQGDGDGTDVGGGEGAGGGGDDGSGECGGDDCQTWNDPD